MWGIVQQSTGERWEDVNLSLSTARPSLAAVLPELDPWYLNVYTPPVPVPLRAASPRIASMSGLPGNQNASMVAQPVAMAAIGFTDEMQEEQVHEKELRTAMLLLPLSNKPEQP